MGNLCTRGVRPKLDGPRTRGATMGRYPESYFAIRVQIVDIPIIVNKWRL